MTTRRRKLKVLNDSQLSEKLGGSHEVELSGNRYTRQVIFTVSLGDAWESSSKNTSVDFDGDAPERIAEAIELNVNGQAFSVPSEFINYLNTYETGINQGDQIVVGFRVPVERKGDRFMTGGLRGSDFSTLNVSLDLRTVSDLTSGNGGYQEGTEIEVTTKESTTGSTLRVPKITDKADQMATGNTNTVELKQDGEYDFLVVEEDGCNITDLQVEVNVPGDEIEVIDMSATALRRKNLQEAGTPDLPAGSYFIDLSEDDRFDSENVNEVDVNVEADTSGGAVFRTKTRKKP